MLESESSSTEPLNGYRCPYCGSDDIVYRTPAWAVHQLFGITADGCILIHAVWDPDVIDGEAELLCRACGTGHPVPRYLTTEYK